MISYVLATPKALRFSVHPTRFGIATGLHVCDSLVISLCGHSEGVVWGGRGVRGEEVVNGREEVGKGREEVGKGREEVGKGREEVGKGREEVGKGREEVDKGREEVWEGREEVLREV